MFLIFLKFFSFVDGVSFFGVLHQCRNRESDLERMRERERERERDRERDKEIGRELEKRGRERKMTLPGEI